MPQVQLEVAFTRFVGEDSEVLADKGMSFTDKHVAKQLSEELTELSGFRQLTVRDVDFGEFREDVYVVNASVVGDVDDDAPEAALAQARENLQEAYDDGMAGQFDIKALWIGGSRFDATDILARMDIEGGLGPRP